MRTPSLSIKRASEFSPYQLDKSSSHTSSETSMSSGRFERIVSSSGKKSASNAKEPTIFVFLASGLGA